MHIMPPALDWGQINVLVDTPKTLRLSNESLIPANFMTKLVVYFNVSVLLIRFTYEFMTLVRFFMMAIGFSYSRTTMCLFVVCNMHIEVCINTAV